MDRHSRASGNPGASGDVWGPLPRERGIALVVALLVLALLSIMGISLLNLSLTEGLIGSNETDLKKAFFAAEAGIQEAMYRMRLDPGTFTDEADTACSSTADPVVVASTGFIQPNQTTIPDPPPAVWQYNAPTCAWTYTPGADSDPRPPGNFFGGKPGNLDSAGRTFTSSGAAHATGGALASANLASTASDGRSYSVTVAPVVGFVGGCWQYVDRLGAALGSCATVANNPMFKVTSTGMVSPTGGAEGARKVISAMIQRYPINPKLDGTLTANSNIKVDSASAVIDGHNYNCEGNSPSDTDSIKAATAPAGVSAPCPPGSDTNVCIKQSDNLQCGGSGTGDTCKGTNTYSFPDTIGALLLGPGASQKEIDALNAYLESIKVAPAAAPDKDGLPFHGIVYVDGDYQRPPNNSSGILIVHHRDASNHDVAQLGPFNSTVIFKGLIIADKIDKINGSSQIIGGVFGFGNASDGVTVDEVNGTPNLKYSKCQIDKLSQIFPYRIVSGTWHEQ